MSEKIINLIRRDFYALWIEKGVGVSVFMPLIFLSPAAPFWRFFSLIFLPIIIQLYSNNVFILEEKYRTGSYFASLPVRRRDIVLSRYFGVIVLVAFHLVLAYSSNLALMLAGKPKFQLLPGYFALALIFASLLTSFSFPFYFKYGATKVMNSLTIVVIGVFYGFIFAVAKTPGLAEKVRNLSFMGPLSTSLLLTGIAILLFIVSIRISTAIYLKRDL